MGSKTILKHTRHGPVLAKRKNETIASLVKRQDKAFKKFKKAKLKIRRKKR